MPKTPTYRIQIKLRAAMADPAQAKKVGVVCGKDAEGEPIQRKHLDVLKVPADITNAEALLLIGAGQAERLEEGDKPEAAPKAKRKSAAKGGEAPASGD